MNIKIVREYTTKLNSGPVTKISPRQGLHKTLDRNSQRNRQQKKLSIGTQATCESSFSMNRSLEFMEDIATNEELLKNPRDLTGMTAQPASLQPSSASDGTDIETINESEAIYYFGYGPIVNALVRYRRGCMISPENVQSAILYDHRLKFVEGGTANIVPKRGWDVKGVLLKFDTHEQWNDFRMFDANYDTRQIAVSVIDKTNIDPKKKNCKTAPFEQGEEDDQIDLDGSENSEVIIQGKRMHKSMIVGGGSSSLNSLEGEDSDYEEEYSCPFSFEPKPPKVDPNAIKCYTFAVDQEEGKAIFENAPHRNGIKGGDVVSKPQERYLKLMTDGLRAHDIDETYIRDEVLAVSYIPNERDKITNAKQYKSFPTAKKVQKVTYQKYETKLCRSKDNAIHFIIGTKVLRVDGDYKLNDSNMVIKWLRALAHGKEDISLLVHQTFIDKDFCLHIPVVSSVDELTPDHHQWAEHTMVLYLERGGLTATTIGELSEEMGGFKGLGAMKMFKRRTPKKLSRISSPAAMAAASTSMFEIGSNMEIHNSGCDSVSFRNTTTTEPKGVGVFGKKKLSRHKKKEEKLTFASENDAS